MSEKNVYNPKNMERSIWRKLHRFSWVIVNSTIFRWSPFFMYGWRRFLLRSFGAKIAKSATIGRKAVIEAPWNLSMGERSMICNNAWLMCYAPISIGNQSMVGEWARILTGSHVSNSTSYKGISSAVSIGENCWIASCAMLVSGGYKKLVIGDGAIVGAGSVVMRNVKPMTVVVGNPAKFLVEREFNKA